MALRKLAFSALARSFLPSPIIPKFLQPIRPRPKNNMILGFAACNFIHTHRLSGNMDLIIEDNSPTIIKETKKIVPTNQNENRPLLVLLCWLLAKRRHIMKFVNFYTEQGFDVVTVSISPWQLMWPVKGSRIIASDLVGFLHQNKHYEQILIHGFSVGGYLWGEALDFLNEDRKKYDQVVNRIVGQIWDSAADISEITIGTPKAMFPHNETLQNLMKKYLEYHMKAFHNQATQYYIRSSQLFYSSLVRTPALLMVSKTDPVGSVTSNMRLRDSWESLGIKTYVKVFEESPHVGHFYKHPKEYVAELLTFLERLKLIQNEEKLNNISNRS